MKYLRTTQFSFYLAHDTVSQLGVFSGLAPLSSDGASQVFLPTDGVASLTDGGSSAPSAGMARLFSMWPLILQPDSQDGSHGGGRGPREPKSQKQSQRRLLGI